MENLSSRLTLMDRAGWICVPKLKVGLKYRKMSQFMRTSCHTITEKIMSTAATNNRETMGFQTEVKQLLQLMIHSLYSNREIFLRELVSNASDACDKLRFEALHNDAMFENDSELQISISYDKEARTLTIADNGIGMSREEVINNLGTIAKSGTREFFSKLSGDQQKDEGLSGQFGVGFY